MLAEGKHRIFGHPQVAHYSQLRSSCANGLREGPVKQASNGWQQEEQSWKVGTSNTRKAQAEGMTSFFRANWWGTDARNGSRRESSQGLSVLDACHII